MSIIDKTPTSEQRPPASDLSKQWREAAEVRCEIAFHKSSLIAAADACDRLQADNKFLHERRGELVIERDQTLAELQTVTERRDKLATQVGELTLKLHSAGALTPYGESLEAENAKLRELLRTLRPYVENSEFFTAAIDAAIREEKCPK